jgi:hypothetical protein
MMNKINSLVTVTALILTARGGTTEGDVLSLRAVTVTPHVQSRDMRYRKNTAFSLGARTQIFIQNTSLSPVSLKPDTDIRLRGRKPKDLLAWDEWAWYDFPDAWKDQMLTLDPGAMTVWTWNGKRMLWGVGRYANISIKLSGEEAATQHEIPLVRPRLWLSAVTFLGRDESPFPERLVFHVANQTNAALRVEACRLWLPQTNATWRALLAQPWISDLDSFPADGMIPPGDRGGAIVSTGRLPLTYVALEVRLRDPGNNPVTLWAHVRIKGEVFDISGGWVSSGVNGRSALTFEPYLKTLRRMHINTGHIGEVGGYTDNPELYARYPLKRFNKLADLQRYDADAMLPQIHAVEFLGEPQYGGGRPVHPMEVWRQLAPYQSTRLATTVTHSEERIWRFYAGLSDYAHYDAYRVNAPAADAWRMYERWGDERIRWGAPLETIGTMTRSLRELNRPASIAYWSQGANNWGRYGGRQRNSPTPQELRAQAYHALAARITSLYWFNLSLKSIVRFPDLIEPISLVGREIGLLADYYLEGDATHYERLTRDSRPDWDVSVVAGPRGAVLFALDLDYQVDTKEKVFRFGPARDAVIDFELPVYMRNPVSVLRVNAHEVTSIPFDVMPQGVRIKDTFGDVNVFVATQERDARERLEARRQALAASEASMGFDPARSSADLEELKAILED